MFFSRRKLLEHGGLVALGSTGLAIGQPGPGFFAARAADNYLPTVADLRDLMPGRYDCVTVLGYHAPGDEGGGTFYWDAASGESDNGGTVLIPQRYSGLPPGARPKGRWKRLTDGDALSAKWFGAKGDRQHDDTPAIQRAVCTLIEADRAGVLYFPPGSYTLKKPIKNSFVGKDGKTHSIGGLRMIGAGSGTSKPVGKPALATFIYNDNTEGQPAFDFEGENGFEIAHLRIVGNPQGGSGVVLTAVERSLFEDLIIDSPGDHGIQARGVIQVEFRRVMIGQGLMGKSAFYFTGGSLSTSLVECYATNGGSGADGVYFEPLADGLVNHLVRVEGGYYESGRYGLYLNTVFGAVIKGVGFEANSADDIRLGTPPRELTSQALGLTTAVTIEGCFGSGHNFGESFVNISHAQQVVVTGCHSVGHKVGVKLAVGVTDGSGEVLMANRIRDVPALDAGAEAMIRIGRTLGDGTAVPGCLCGR